MRNFLIYLAIFFATITIFGAYEPVNLNPFAPEQKIVSVIKVVDGDTFSFFDGYKVVNTRMIGIDAPESNTLRYGYTEQGGDEAKAFLTNLISNSTVTIQYDKSQGKTDKYGRHLIYLFVDGVNINNLMIKKGFAKEYTYDKAYKYQDMFRASERNN